MVLETLLELVLEMGPAEKSEIWAAIVSAKVSKIVLAMGSGMAAVVLVTGAEVMSGME